ncbi:MAG: small multi-drug export protein [Ruminococcus sp.]|nr:small multi-drug export protein [Ruminococcus sp.]
MVPLVELRGGVPFGTGMDLPWHWCLIVCMIGNMIPVPLIFFFARKLLLWGSKKKVVGKFCNFCLQKGERGGKKLQEKAGKGIYVALLLFVGIPLPGTGAWTGTLAASILDLDFKKSTLAVVLGVLLAGIIMTVVSQVVKGGFALF